MFPLTQEVINTFTTPHGRISLLANESIIGQTFINGHYWDCNSLEILKKFIDPTRNILEVGGHCGTSSIMYASYLNSPNKVFVYEPQKNMYDLLLKNINQNNLQNTIIPYNYGVFCFNGKGSMDDTEKYSGGNVEKRYTTETQLGCNFGGVGIGEGGEDVNFTTIDTMGHDNIGFIHCDAQGAEPFLFYHGRETIKRDRPIIFYEDPFNDGRMYFDTVCKAHPQCQKESQFDIKDYCLNELNYKLSDIDTFPGNILLLP
jgi:FkbM family methyltransferase